MKKIFYTVIISACLLACNKGKNLADPILVTEPERIEITPATISITTGQTATYTAKYFNNMGKETAIPTNAIWASNNENVASISNGGIATGITVGQTTVKLSINGLIAQANINVVANNNVVANINLMPFTTQEVLLNGSVNMVANGVNLTGNGLPNLMYTWASDAPAIVSINNNGVATALAYGNASVKATSSNIQSAPTTIQVIRQGIFTRNNSMGTAKLKIDNGVLRLTTSANFSISSAPDLRLFLTNSSTTINTSNSILIAPLTSAGISGGARSWNVPSNVSITQYRYAMVWCVQFGGVYGIADFGN